MTMNQQNFGEIITFYSYKGGTGRSMALANVAYLLATDPSYSARRILVIDWDLEAPGLHKFFYKDFKKSFGTPSTTKYDKALTKAPGLIDFLTSVFDYYKSNLPSDELPENKAMSNEAINIFQKALSKFPLKNYLLKLDGLPSLFLMKAGSENPVPPRDNTGGAKSKDVSYATKVRKLNWEQFYIQYGSFFAHFREYLMGQYDYVLIDSRTGLNDTSGICTRVMPEKLVCVFVPNLQNIEGNKSVIRKVTEYRINSRDPRGLVVFPIASRIDVSSSKLRDIWWHGGMIEDDHIDGYQKIFEDLFKEIYELDECHLSGYFDATQIPHDSDYAYGEKIAVRSRTSDRLSMGHSYEAITRRLVTLSTPWEKLPTHGEQAKEDRRRAEEKARQELELKSKARRLKPGIGLTAGAISAFMLLMNIIWLQERVSSLSILGVPDMFGFIALAFGFILTLAPHVAGTSFGGLKVWEFNVKVKHVLRTIGLILLLASVLLFLNIWRGPAIDFKASIEEDTAFALKGHFEGQAKIRRNEILVRVNEVLIEFPRENKKAITRATKKTELLVASIRINLARDTGNGSWKPVRQSNAISVQRNIREGGSIAIDPFERTLSTADINSLSGFWLVFSIEVGNHEESSVQGFSYAHTRRDLFTLLQELRSWIF